MESERERIEDSCSREIYYWSKHCLKRYVLRLALKGGGGGGGAVTEREEENSRCGQRRSRKHNRHADDVKKKS